MHSDNKKLLSAFNDIFFSAFEIEAKFNLPFVLFFNVKEREVTDVEIVELEQTNLLFAFQELYKVIGNYVSRIKNESVERVNPKTNKLTKFMESVKKIALDKFINWLVDKGAEKLYENI